MIAAHRLVTASEVLAEIFGETAPPVAWLERMRREKLIPAYAIGASFRYSVPETRRAISQNLKIDSKNGSGKRRRKPGRPRKYAVKDLEKLIPDEGLKFNDMIDRAIGHGISESSAKRLLHRALADARILKEGVVYHAAKNRDRK